MRAGVMLGCSLAFACALLPLDAAPAGQASGQMGVGLTLVAGPPAAIPEPAALPYPASPNAVMCRSLDDAYQECRTPFRGGVRLSREVTGTRCIENTNWGWRDGMIWVDRGCSAVFIRTDA